MYIALNEGKIRVEAERAKENEKFFCPMCGLEVILKKGNIRARHFAHKATGDCDDFKKEASEWRKRWQQKFPVNTREIVLEHNGEKHRVDVCIGKYVFDFQPASITSKEFDRRNKFYTDCGYDVMWVFGLSSHTQEKRLKRIGEYEYAGRTYTKWQWKRPWHTWDNFNPTTEKRITVLFETTTRHLTDSIADTKDRYLNRIVWAQNENDAFSYSKFSTAEKPYNFNCLYNYILKQSPKQNTTSSAYEIGFGFFKGENRVNKEKIKKWLHLGDELKWDKFLRYISRCVVMTESDDNSITVLLNSPQERNNFYQSVMNYNNDYKKTEKLSDKY